MDKTIKIKVKRSGNSWDSYKEKLACDYLVCQKCALFREIKLENGCSCHYPEDKRLLLVCPSCKEELLVDTLDMESEEYEDELVSVMISLYNSKIALIGEKPNVINFINSETWKNQKLLEIYKERSKVLEEKLTKLKLANEILSKGFLVLPEDAIRHINLKELPVVRM